LFVTIECLGRSDPPNARLQCESKKLEQGSTCVLICDPGYIPVAKTIMTCELDSETNQHDWNIAETEFACIEPIAFVIGGIAADYTYLNEVEVLAPGFDCSKQLPIVPYPHKIVGASAGYALGQSIVCGGGKFEYVECRRHAEGSRVCNTNIQCVKTTGGAEWCTGPKTSDCFSYNFIMKVMFFTVCTLSIFLCRHYYIS
jgi:hypothetical protein